MKTLEFLNKNYLETKRQICVAREITKMYEQKISGDIHHVYEYFKNNPEKVRGEFVVLIDKA